MAKGQSLIKLAKGGDKKEKTPKKPAEKKVKETPLTPEQERDLKAKQKVEELLQDVPLISNPKKDDELLELADSETAKNIEWFEEQLKALSSENSILKTELEVAKKDYTKLFTEFQKIKQGKDVALETPNVDTALKAQIVKLFNEIQANHLALGKNFIIVPVAFLNRLIMFFPFLQDEKRY